MASLLDLDWAIWEVKMLRMRPALGHVPAQMPVCVTAAHADSLLGSAYSPLLRWDVLTLAQRAGLWGWQQGEVGHFPGVAIMRDVGPANHGVL